MDLRLSPSNEVTMAVSLMVQAKNKAYKVLQKVLSASDVMTSDVSASF